jgi:hypothetical protein
MITHLIAFVAITLTQTSTVSAREIQPVQIKWETLAPPEGNQYRDPFAKLTRKQLDRIGFFVRIQKLIAAEKISADSDSAVEAEKIAKQLKQQGVDIPWLMAQREQVTALREKQELALTKSIAKRLDDKRIKLAGFVVPLKFTNGRVTEFYLAPSIATCSHSSAPPANQVVYVTSKTGIEFNGRRTTAMWFPSMRNANWKMIRRSSVP